MKQRIAFAIAAMVALGVTVSGAGSSAHGQSEAQTAGNKPLTIGVILPLTGDFSFFGEQVRQGMEVALDEVNAKLKRPVKLIFEDDKCLPKFAVTAFTKLTKVDKVDLILGPGCTGSILAIAPLADRNGSDVIALLDAGEQITNAGPHLFSLGYVTEEMGYLMADLLKTRGVKSAAIVYEADEWATLVKDSFKKRFTANGGTILADEIQNVTDKDYRPLLLKIAKTKPEVLYAAPAYNGGHLLKQLRELNLDWQVFGPDTFGVQEVLDIAKDAAQGVTFGNVRVDESSDAAKHLRAELKSRFNAAPEGLLYAALGYDGLRIAARALSPAESGLPGTLTAALEAIRYHDGVIAVDGFDKNGIAKLTLVPLQIENGKFVELPAAK